MDPRLAGIGNLGIAVTLEVLEHIHVVVRRGVGNVLESDSICAIREVAFLNCRGRGLRIVDRCTRDLIGRGLRGGRRGDGIGKLMCLDLHEVGVEDDFLPRSGRAFVVVLSRDVVDGNVVELCHDGHVASNHGRRGDLFASGLINPLLKHLASNKRVLRHGANCLAIVAVVLGKALGHSAVIVKDHEADGVLVIKLGDDREVGSHCHSASKCLITKEPTLELLALNRGIAGDVGGGDGVAVIVGIGLVGRAFHHVLNGEGVLGVLGPDTHLAIGVSVLVDANGVAEVAAAVDPLRGVTLLRGNSGDVVQAVAGA